MPGIMDLLVQVCNVHAEGRPDLFVRDATKYDEDELREIVHDDGRPVFVAVADDAPDGEVLGYAFCVMQDWDGNNATGIKSLYVDDLCVDAGSRGQHVGTALYRHVLDYARERGCYNVTLNVWTCNPKALGFYEAMGMRRQKITMEEIL